MNSTRFTLTVTTAICLVFCLLRAAWAAPDPRITLVSPTHGAVYAPGDPITFNVNVDPAVVVSKVYVIPRMDSGLPHYILTSAPYEKVDTIPLDHHGEILITIGVEDQTGTLLEGPQISVFVRSTVPPDKLEVENISVIATGFPVSAAEMTSNNPLIHVYGYYNGEQRNIAGAQYGTTYTSSDTSVATVDSRGWVTPHQYGIAYVTVANSGVTAFSQVKIKTPNNRLLAPIEQTANVTIVNASGFRLDTKSRQYIQRLTLRNDGSLPIPFPVHIVLSDFPEGVYLLGGGRTKVVTPLESRYKFIKFEPRYDWWPPGVEVTVDLSFGNRDGRPITYTSRFFSGLDL